MSTVIRPEGHDSVLGPCHSWKDQQKRISDYISHNKLQSALRTRLLLAQHDNETVTVYQAYKPSIGLSAARNGHFRNSEFSFSRMTWIKPSFSWIMNRSGWATKKNQELVLAIRLHRQYFDELLEQSVETRWDAAKFSSIEEWRIALKDSDVLVQWDPEHHVLSGAPLSYRVIQIGIRRKALEGFNSCGIVSILNITERVHELRKEPMSVPSDCDLSCENETPLETIYSMEETTRTKRFGKCQLAEL